MKISALRKMIREEVRSAVRAELKAALNESASRPAPQKQSGEGLDALRARFKQSQQGSLTEMYDGLEGSKPKGRSNASEPDNPRELLENGEPFASGAGLLEWFKESKDEAALAQHEQALAKQAKTDEYVKNLMGGNR